jgi:NADPH:quinone reductase-like Zn-dependent oxidoreductase
MADNVGYTPGSGATVAADEIGGVLYQRMKPVVGVDGVAVDVSADSPLPSVSNQTDDLLRMLSRIVKLLESNAVVDQQQRQRLTLDSITAGVTLPTVTTVGTVSAITGGTITTVSGITAVAGMDREQYINIARTAYNTGIRTQLQFV